MPPIITLTTDFGTIDSYVAQMKGVILAINPLAQIVDVTHHIPPQDVFRAASVVDEIAHVFPAGTIHVAVVDPGVGSSRAIVAAEAEEQRFIAPDNGLLGPVLARFPAKRVHRVSEESFWRRPVSATFHGRDIFAPVAAHWSRGTNLSQFGPSVEVTSLVSLPRPELRQEGAVLVGRIEAIDTFGNLITNIDRSQLAGRDDSSLTISVAGQTISSVDRCYADRPSGVILALVGSSGRLEIAVSGGNAAACLNAVKGMEVRVE